jgi:dihydropteroate synthase
MSVPPRLLWVTDEAGARRELFRIGVDPAGIARMAPKMVGRLVKIRDVPCPAANILKQEMLSLGGDAAVARGSVACSLPTTDVLLIGSLKQLRLLAERLGRQPFGLREQAARIGVLLERLEHPPTFLGGRGLRLELDRPRIMGILNVTPDSFSDGGRFLSLSAALERARVMEGEGVDLIDVGGESTRPGAPGISPQEEMDRVVPVVEALGRGISCPISVDTSKSAVARAALAAGAHFINDVSGLHYDPAMAAVVADAGAGLFLMHTRGVAATMQVDTEYGDLVGEILEYLRAGMARAEAAGIPEDALAVDPGIGFGKDVAGNLEILRRLGEFRALGRPLLLGTSRKGFIGKVLDQPEPSRRLYGTLATVALGVRAGAMIHRVHEVAPAREAALMAWAVQGERVATETL